MFNMIEYNNNFKLKAINLCISLQSTIYNLHINLKIKSIK